MWIRDQDSDPCFSYPEFRNIWNRGSAKMKSEKYTLLEHDPTLPAIVEPSQVVKQIDTAEHCVFCFFGEVIEELKQECNLRIIAHQRWEDLDRPLYEMEFEGKRLAVFQPGVGAPLAAAMLEEVIARGCRKFIACGGSGVLDSQIAVGSLLIPTVAVRDEGTSFHYLPPNREVEADQKTVKAIEDILQQHDVQYSLVKTWTTDGPYRETPEKIELRKAEGCLTVEMEAAAFFAVAQFRQVDFGLLLYGGDDVSGATWDTRDWQDHKDIRIRMFWLAAEICLSL
jgi:uridine phosphorylase